MSLLCYHLLPGVVLVRSLQANFYISFQEGDIKNKSHVSYKVQHTPILCPKNYALMYFYLRQMKILSTPHKNLYINVHSNITLIGQNWKPKCSSTDEWMNKLQNTYIMDNSSAVKKEELMTQGTTQMNLPDIVLSKGN